MDKERREKKKCYKTIVVYNTDCISDILVKEKRDKI
jgi:hypothetical protein